MNTNIGKIYKITNNINDKVYIGQTIQTIKTRFKNHLATARCNNSHSSAPIYRAIKKYGEENFSIEIVEDNIPSELLDEREQYWIQYYDSYYSGYNATLGGQGKGSRIYDYQKIVNYYLNNNKSSILTEKHFHCSCSVVRNALLSFNILPRIEYNRQWIINYFKENPNSSIAQIAKLANVAPTTVSNILEKEGLRCKETESHAQYAYEHQQDVIDYYLKNKTLRDMTKYFGVHESVIKDILFKNNIKQFHTREKYNLYEIAQAYKKYQNQKDVMEHTGCYPAVIIRACKKYNIPLNDQAMAKNARRGKVVQYDLQGNYINQYDSSAEAVRQIFGYNNKSKTGNINACIRGASKNSFNYIWRRYKPEETILKKIEV